MAQVTLRITDRIDGGVHAEVTPPAGDLFQKIASYGPGSLTPAETYALAAINLIRKEGKKPRGNIIVPVPRIGR